MNTHLSELLVELEMEDSLQQFLKIRRAVLDLPELDLGQDSDGNEVIVSCHMLARAVSRCFSLAFVDGLFVNTQPHSWIVDRRENVFDIYPVGMISDGSPNIAPIFVFRNVAQKVYTKDIPDAFPKPDLSAEWFQESVDKITHLLREANVQ